MTNVKNLIIANRKTSTAINSNAFETKLEYINWRDSIEALRLSVSDYAVASLENADDDTLNECETLVFNAYRIVLSTFTDKSIGQKFKAQHGDLNSLLTFIGAYKATKDENGKKDGKKFMPIGTTSFRKALEDFIVDRFTGANYTTAEEIENAKKAKRKAVAAKAKAKKEAEKAKEVKKISA